MKEIADSQLFELIQQSSYPAFTALYNRHWKYIYSIAYRKTANKDDAFDLTQNVFIEFYEKRDKLVVNIPLKNFLRTAMIYKLSNYFRTRGFQEKHYRNFQQYLEQAEATGAYFDSLEINENEQDFEQMVALIHQAIDDMPDKMKTVFLMSRSEKYSIAEIAHELHISPQTVKNQISKAFEKIRLTARKNHIPAAKIMFLIWLTQA